jgi:ubiquinone/menaquinone biosynthesis C-methylase UbiE
MIKLNLASGTDLRPPPWVNLDIVPRWPLTTRGCDVIWDARRDSIPFVDNFVDEVYAGYLFLHLAPHHHARVLADIRRVLKPGGRLVVGEVDMDQVLRRWLVDPTDRRCAELIWGEQGDVHGAQFAEFDKHCHGYTEGALTAFLASGGFPGCRRIRVHSAEVWYELTLETFKGA